MIKNIFLEKIVLPIGDKFFNTSFSYSLNYWRKFKYFSELELEKFQEIQLKNQLEFAIKNVSKYKGILYSSSETASQLLTKFPILTKDVLKENIDELNIDSKEKITKIFSSGSTGVSTSVNMNKKDLMSIQSLSFHIWELCGYKIGDAVIQTGISPNRTLFKKLKDIFFGTIYISAFALKERDLIFICKKLSKNKNITIIGYPSSINIIANYALENNFKIKISKVIGLGDALFTHHKKNIEKAFQCKIMETYGSSEGFQIGFQVDLNYMYIFTPQVYLELLDDNGFPVKDGEIGNVVVTRLDNKHMPLIRYKLGDLAIKLPKEKYPSKRKYNFPLLEKVVGRNTDVVLLPNDSKMVVHSFTGIFEHIDGIKQFKIIQKDRNGIIIQYIPSKKFTEAILKTIIIKLQEYIQNKSFLIEFEKVNEIKSYKSGKPQIVESLL